LSSEGDNDDNTKEVSVTIHNLMVLLLIGIYYHGAEGNYLDMPCSKGA
jgi:hypothetical protein